MVGLTADPWWKDYPYSKTESDGGSLQSLPVRLQSRVSKSGLSTENQLKTESELNKWGLFFVLLVLFF